MTSQTFHTPSFGDDEFHIIDLPTMQSSIDGHAPPAATYGSLSTSMIQQSHNAGATAANNTEMMAPKFPPQHFEVPDIMYTSGIATSPNHSRPVSDHDSSINLNRTNTAYYSDLAMSPAYTVSPMVSHVSPMVSFATPHPPSMSTINQSQMSCHLGFKTVSPKHGSPTNTSHPTSSPKRESSEDSDDSLPLSQLSGALKRPVQNEPTKSVDRKPIKKPKTPKRKKKKDPNEPQKPVSAYALFFRDTQAAIKGQNHSASFGEVSKIVASMWDSLDPDSKAEYKRRTEEAKKEYLKALAAYRASIVSQQTPQDHADTLNIHTTLHQKPNQPPHTFTNIPGSGGMQPIQPSVLGMATMPQTMVTVSRHSPQQPTNLSPQSLVQMSPVNEEQLSYSSQLHQGMLMNEHIHQLPPLMPSPDQTLQRDHPLSNMSPPNHMLSMHPDNYLTQNNLVPPAMCVRTGCNNHAIDSPGWDNDYCSNDCVITHCRDAFSAWVAERQTTYTHVK